MSVSFRRHYTLESHLAIISSAFKKRISCKFQESVQSYGFYEAVDCFMLKLQE